MLTILFLTTACISEEEQADRDALWVQFQAECLVNGLAEDARKEPSGCKYYYNIARSECAGYKEHETAVVESNARITDLVAKRKAFEARHWNSRHVEWSCTNGVAFGTYIDHY